MRKGEGIQVPGDPELVTAVKAAAQKVNTSLGEEVIRVVEYPEVKPLFEFEGIGTVTHYYCKGHLTNAQFKQAYTLSTGDTWEMTGRIRRVHARWVPAAGLDPKVCSLTEGKPGKGAFAITIADT